MMSRSLNAFLIMLVILWIPLCSYSLTFKLPDDPRENVLGEAYTIKTKQGDTLRKIARRYDMGVIEMQQANQEFTIDEKLSADTNIIVPAMYILPPGPREGIVVDLDEYRVYSYLPERNEVVTYPIGIGKDGWNTPVFSGRIIKKKANPEWNVPKSVYDYNKEKGIVLPKVMPPGPNNPLGQYALYTSKPGYLLHGTNRPNGVGDRVSSGCLRFRAENIEQLFNLTSVGTRIRVILAPYKIGYKNGVTYLEAHKPLEGYDDIYETSLTPLISMVLLNNNDNTHVDWDHAYMITKQHNGIPQPFSDLS